MANLYKAVADSAPGCLLPPRPTPLTGDSLSLSRTWKGYIHGHPGSLVLFSALASSGTDSPHVLALQRTPSRVLCSEWRTTSAATLTPPSVRGTSAAPTSLSRAARFCLLSVRDHAHCILLQAHCISLHTRKSSHQTSTHPTRAALHNTACSHIDLVAMAAETLKAAAKLAPKDYTLWNKLGATLANAGNADHSRSL